MKFNLVMFFGSHLWQSTRHTWGTLNFYIRHCGGCYISEVFDTSCFHHSRLGFNMSIHRMSRLQYVLYHTRPVCTNEIPWVLVLLPISVVLSLFKKIGDSRSSMKFSPQEFVITGLLSGLLVFPIFCGLVMMPGSSSWPWPSGITENVHLWIHLRRLQSSKGTAENKDPRAFNWNPIRGFEVRIMVWRWSGTLGKITHDLMFRV